MSTLQRCENALARLAAGAAPGAFEFVDAQGARASAHDSDARLAAGLTPRPLEGLLVGIKANVAVAGWPHTAGLALRREHVATRDATVVARLRAAGAVLLGSTAMDEAALGATGRSIQGVIENPAAPGRSAGGSSGGSAAAVAAKICDLTIGTDTIGSIRIPAAFCGAYGLKPSPGVVPSDGLVATHADFDLVGTIASNLPLLALAHDIITQNRILGDHRKASDGSLADRTFGYARDLDAVGATPITLGAYQRKLDTLRAAGATLVPIDCAPLELPRLRRAIFTLCEHALAREHAQTLQTRPDAFSPGLRALLRFGAGVDADKVEALTRRVAAFRATFAAATAALEGFLIPTTPDAAFDLARPSPDDLADFTVIATAAGLAALNLPMHDATLDEPPLGLQIVASHDAAVLELGGAIEARSK